MGLFGIQLRLTRCWFCFGWCGIYFIDENFNVVGNMVGSIEGLVLESGKKTRYPWYFSVSLVQWPGSPQQTYGLWKMLSQCTLIWWHYKLSSSTCRAIVQSRTRWRDLNKVSDVLWTSLLLTSSKRASQLWSPSKDETSDPLVSVDCANVSWSWYNLFPHLPLYETAINSRHGEK